MNANNVIKKKVVAKKPMSSTDTNIGGLFDYTKAQFHNTNFTKPIRNSYSDAVLTHITKIFM